jgi:hypothetical protein
LVELDVFSHGFAANVLHRGWWSFLLGWSAGEVSFGAGDEVARGGEEEQSGHRRLGENRDGRRDVALLRIAALIRIAPG